jgi:large subunit ribosomal protein L5
MVETARLKALYREKITQQMMHEFGYQNVMQVPRLTKVVVNIGLGEAVQNQKALEAAAGDLATITGQSRWSPRPRRALPNSSYAPAWRSARP